MEMKSDKQAEKNNIATNGKTSTVHRFLKEITNFTL